MCTREGSGGPRDWKARCGSDLGLPAHLGRSQADLLVPARQSQEPWEGAEVTEAALSHGGHSEPGRCPPSRRSHGARLVSRAVGNIFSVGVTAGLPTPELLLLLDRCWTTGAPAAWGRAQLGASQRAADRAGLKVVIISVELLLLRRMAASGSRITMVCRGLAGSELMGPGGVLQGLQGVQHHIWRLLDRVLPLQLSKLVQSRTHGLLNVLGTKRALVWLELEAWGLDLPGAVRLAGSLGRLPTNLTGWAGESVPGCLITIGREINMSTVDLAEAGSTVRQTCSNPDSTASLLYDPGQVTVPLSVPGILI